MKQVRYRIIFFIALIYIVFLAGMVVIQHSELRRVSSLIEQTRQERNLLLGKVIGLQGKGLESYVYDYSYWDDMLKFVNRVDPRWAVINIDNVMPTFNVQCIWLFNKNLDLVYSASALPGKKMLQFPLAKDNLREILGRKWFNRFFIRTSSGIFEVRTAPLQSGSDVKRESAPGGFLIAARQWSKDYLGDLSQLMAGKVNLIDPMDESLELNRQAENRFTVVTTKKLPGWDKKPVAALKYSSESEVLRKLLEASNTQITLNIIFGLIILGATTFFLINFIGLPLKLISGSLRHSDPSLLKNLKEKQNEFGTLASLVIDSFEQGKKLTLAKEAAESASRAKSMFLANISHEFRTPLNVIMGFAELLKSEVHDRKSREYLSGITDSGKGLLKLINDILDLSKIEAERIEIKREPVNPYLLLNEISRIFSQTLRQKSVDFKMEIDPGVPGKLMLDEVRLRQILFNLIGNAVKFTNSGRVTLRLKANIKERESGKTDLFFEVSDTGIGIPEDQFELIFESFRQREGQSTKKYGGTGLGLTITKRLIEMMQGSISVESRLGQGSTFRFNLPDVEIISGSEDHAIELSEEESIKSLPEPAKVDENARELLSNGLLNQWQSVKEGMLIDEITAFAAEVKKLGESCSSEVLVNFGVELSESADSFKVEEINKLLEDFPKLVEQLT
ncbi:MAG: hypothetical protein HF314_17565 [Ignavibacteria bacterium]|jgi:signal transduction histidine kinase|nr:hypothetical protein [Ignavibacteria bacterium]MCU7504895.1 hypothetical protein [Ignavibacteria bacterium]MCU7517813.1 hypothetical protein [Ignavibacteria bacterium]